MPLKFYVRLLSISPLYLNKQVLLEINHETGKGWIECFDLGHLAIMVAGTYWLVQRTRPGCSCPASNSNYLSEYFVYAN